MAIIPKGQEPVNIQKRMDILFSKLDEAYPDKVIVSLQKDHKKWGETVTELYRALGYSDGASFLEAYGYSYVRNTGGRSRTIDPQEIVRELQLMYPDGSPFTSADELFAANPEYTSKLKTIKNTSSEVFGMPLGKYLLSIGLIQAKQRNQSENKLIIEKNYDLCTVAPIVGADGMYTCSGAKAMHIGDYVEILLWNRLSICGVVTNTITCTEQTAPCDIKCLDSINRRIGIRLFESNFLRNVLCINAANKSQSLRRTPVPDNVLLNRPCFPNDALVKWACCRGLTIEIMRVLDYLVEKEKQVYAYTDIILIDDLVAELHIFGADISDVLTRFPSLKIVMFAVSKESKIVSLWYSYSGANYITCEYEIGVYDNKNDWTLKHAPSESEFSIPSGKYIFKYEKDWNQIRFICDTTTGTQVLVEEANK